ncbi:hypothetical protein ACH0B5_03640 [Ureibacillus sp. 179-F W5.1 NHS]|uniref:hypothetical protein n=1 Tax=Ureibacillus sp. 179-F W5.1 NHS TaxID=3374297 RepID=UPI003879603D
MSVPPNFEDSSTNSVEEERIAIEEQTINEETPNEYGLKYWLITLLLLAIPFVNIGFIIYWAFFEKKEPRKSFTRAYLIIFGSFFVLYMLLIAVFFFFFAMAYFQDPYEYFGESTNKYSDEYGYSEDYEYTEDYLYEDSYLPTSYYDTSVVNGVEIADSWTELNYDYEWELFVDLYVSGEQEVNEIKLKVEQVDIDGTVLNTSYETFNERYLPGNNYQVQLDLTDSYDPNVAELWISIVGENDLNNL